MYLLLHLSFNISVGIRQTTTQVSSNQHDTAIVCDIIMTSDIIIGSIVTS